jgi:hypothetical protein
MAPMSEIKESLTRFGAMAKSHWETFRPRMVAHLKKEGVYHDALVNAQEQATAQIGEQVSKRGNDLESAREAALQMFVLLPSEAEEPILPADRMPFSQPEPTTISPTTTKSASAR